MSEPTVKQVIQARAELEQQIHAMIATFERRCGVSVYRVDVTREHLIGGGSRLSSVEIKVDI